MLQVRNKQIRAALKWQVIVTLSIAAAMGALFGNHGCFSALLGGLVSIAASVTYGVMISRIGRGSAGMALSGMIRAESAKVLVIVLLLWVVFSAYQDVSGVGFIGTFAVTTVIFSLAIFIKDK